MVSRHTGGLTDALGQFFAAPFDVATYKRLLYLLLAAPLGFLYFMGLTTGLSTGLGLLISVLGVPLLLLTLVGVTGAAHGEAYLSEWLLDRPVPAPTALDTFRAGLQDPETGYLDAAAAFLTDPTTWCSLGVVALHAVFGLAAFVLLTVAGTLVSVMAAAPLLYDHPEVAYQTATHAVTTFPEAMLVSAAGLCLGLVSLNVLSAVAVLRGSLTQFLLDIPDRPEAR